MSPAVHLTSCVVHHNKSPQTPGHHGGFGASFPFPRVVGVAPPRQTRATHSWKQRAVSLSLHQPGHWPLSSPSEAPSPWRGGVWGGRGGCHSWPNTGRVSGLLFPGIDLVLAGQAPRGWCWRGKMLNTALGSGKPQPCPVSQEGRGARGHVHLSPHRESNETLPWVTCSWVSLFMAAVLSPARQNNLSLKEPLAGP